MYMQVKHCRTAKCRAVYGGNSAIKQCNMDGEDGLKARCKLVVHSVVNERSRYDSDANRKRLERREGICVINVIPVARYFAEL